MDKTNNQRIKLKEQEDHDDEEEESDQEVEEEDEEDEDEDNEDDQDQFAIELNHEDDGEEYDDEEDDDDNDEDLDNENEDKNESQLEEQEEENISPYTNYIRKNAQQMQAMSSNTVRSELIQELLFSNWQRPIYEQERTSLIRREEEEKLLELTQKIQRIKEQNSKSFHTRAYQPKLSKEIEQKEDDSDSDKESESYVNYLPMEEEEEEENDDEEEVQASNNNKISKEIQKARKGQLIINQESQETKKKVVVKHTQAKLAQEKPPKPAQVQPPKAAQLVDKSIDATQLADSSKNKDKLIEEALTYSFKDKLSFFKKIKQQILKNKSLVSRQLMCEILYDQLEEEKSIKLKLLPSIIGYIHHNEKKIDKRVISQLIEDKSFRTNKAKEIKNVISYQQERDKRSQLLSMQFKPFFSSLKISQFEQQKSQILSETNQEKLLIIHQQILSQLHQQKQNLMPYDKCPQFKELLQIILLAKAQIYFNHSTTATLVVPFLLQSEISLGLIIKCLLKPLKHEALFSPAAQVIRALSENHKSLLV